MIYHYYKTVEQNMLVGAAIKLMPVDHLTRYIRVDLIKHEVITVIRNDITGETISSQRGRIVEINKHPCVEPLEPPIHLGSHHIDNISFEDKPFEPCYIDINKCKHCDEKTFLIAMEIL